MATKHYNCEYFSYDGLNGFTVSFEAYTTYTRHGFCHTVRTFYRDGDNWVDLTDTKVSYLNRTWEAFRYESALKSAIKKLPKAQRAIIYAQAIERKALAEAMAADSQFDRIEAIFKVMKEIA